jgi:hypothetical protein
LRRWRAHTVLFDKTGTLTVGGARLLSIEVAPGETAEEVLMLGASLEQASHHVLLAFVGKLNEFFDLRYPSKTAPLEILNSIFVTGAVESACKSAVQVHRCEAFIFSHFRAFDCAIG